MGYTAEVNKGGQYKAHGSGVKYLTSRSQLAAASYPICLLQRILNDFLCAPYIKLTFALQLTGSQQI